MYNTFEGTYFLRLIAIDEKQEAVVKIAFEDPELKDQPLVNIQKEQDEKNIRESVNREDEYILIEKEDITTI